MIVTIAELVVAPCCCRVFAVDLTVLPLKLAVSGVPTDEAMQDAQNAEEPRTVLNKIDKYTNEEPAIIESGHLPARSCA